MAKRKFKTREEWLTALVNHMRPAFKKKGFPLPEHIRVGCGWPSSRALSTTRRTLGEYWHPDASRDQKAANVVISLALDDREEVAGTVVHELAHAATPGAGHKGPFVECIRAMGLLGKPTEAATPDRQLAESFSVFFKRAGVYPHVAVDGSKRKKQGTRLIKLQCPDPDCGYTVRTTQKWIDLGYPVCPCGETFQGEEEE